LYYVERDVIEKYQVKVVVKPELEILWWTAIKDRWDLRIEGSKTNKSNNKKTVDTVCPISCTTNLVGKFSEPYFRCCFYLIWHVQYSKCSQKLGLETTSGDQNHIIEWKSFQLSWPSFQKEIWLWMLVNLYYDFELSVKLEWVKWW
jgi:hypothetical protein